MVSAGEQLPIELHETVLSGTGIGGARPKALANIGEVPSLVKFSVSTDIFPAVEAEALASNLAARASINTAAVQAMFIGGRYALASTRFDRAAGSGERRLVVSALTIAGRDELNSRYGTYPELVQKLVAESSSPPSVGPQMFSRIAFNMMISNNDDHLRNHAAFWDGKYLELTPAYDLAPAARREGAQSTQTLAYGADGEKFANLRALISQAHLYWLNEIEAESEVERLLDVVKSSLDDASEEMEIPSASLAIIRSSFLHETVTQDLYL
ncbi:type II toxin-antitoxin system HipA family toxin [Lysinibacter cavernae]|uniref:type II toxin-antitoxin system HipA family toxin n=1 Tax=Lysinibacter cavernae TaxID=1640652 RepID=UPI003612204D